MRTIVIASLVATAGFATLSGQTEPGSGDDMKALVAEVRALRLAVERTSAHASQAHVLLGRVQLQESRLATLVHQYQEARSRTFDAHRALGELEQQLQRVPNALRNTTDPQERQALEDRLPEMKAAVARQQDRTAQMRSDEQAAFEALSTEQRRWSDFNERLESLERVLATPARP